MSEKKAKKEKPAVEGFLPALAKEINVRLEKAEQIVGKAEEHRLAAAIRLEEARKKCKASRVSFKDWCAKNVKYAYESVRKLVRIGSAPDPKKALEDLRHKTKKAMKKSRAKKRAVSADPVAVIETALAALPEEKAAAVVKQQAKKLKIEAPAAKEGSGDKLADAKFAFDALSATQKLHMLAYVSEKMDAKVTLFDRPLSEVVAEQAGAAAPASSARRLRRTA